MIMIDVILQKAERIISQAARKYLGNIDGYEYEDLMQNGRLLVWQLIVDKDITEDNFESFSGYLYKSLIFSYSNDYKKSKAQKRINLSKTTSLDKEVGIDDTRSLHEILPSKNNDITLETLEIIKSAALKDKDPKAIKGVIYCLVELLDILPEEVPKR